MIIGARKTGIGSFQGAGPVAASTTRPAEASSPSPDSLSLTSEVQGAQHASNADPKPPRHLDTIVVGGGVGGLYTAWRRKGADGAGRTGASVAIFERSQRIGGRIDSVQPPGMPHVKAEFGAMRYLPDQDLIASLIDKLKLPSELFTVAGQGNLAYFKGQRLPAEEIGKLGAAYGVRPDEMGKSPHQLWSDAIKATIPNAESLTEEQWSRIALEKNIEIEDTIDGTRRGFPMSHLSPMEALQPKLSHGAFNFFRDTNGYDVLTDQNCNAADALEWYMKDFSATAPYRTLTGGMGELTETMHQQFLANEGEVHCGHELKRFSYDEEKKTWLVEFSTGEKTETFTCDNLVLAMPRKSLEMVAEHSPLLAQPEVQELLSSVTPLPMAKMLLCYETPWWKDKGIEAGRSVTDLPLRQTYYKDTEGDQPGADPSNRNSLMLASYTDGRALKFWEQYLTKEDQAGASGENTVGAHRWQEHAMPEAMLTEVHRQMQELHGDSNLPKPYAAAVQYWAGEPYGGAVNLWNKGVNPDRVAEEILQPLRKVPGYAQARLFICGEAYSADQGWIEGALETAEQVVQRLGSAPAPWRGQRFSTSQSEA